MDLRGRSLLKVTDGPVDRDGQVRAATGREPPASSQAMSTTMTATVQFAPAWIPATRPSGPPHASLALASSQQRPGWDAANLPRAGCPHPAGPSPSPARTYACGRSVPPCLTGSRRGTSGIMAADA